MAKGNTTLNDLMVKLGKNAFYDVLLQSFFIDYSNYTSHSDKKYSAVSATSYFFM